MDLNSVILKGGMKAVLLTDVLQSILMFAALFTVIIKGTYDVGGLRKVFDIAYKGGRLNFNKYCLFGTKI